MVPVWSACYVVEVGIFRNRGGGKPAEFHYPRVNRQSSQIVRICLKTQVTRILSFSRSIHIHIPARSGLPKRIKKINTTTAISRLNVFILPINTENLYSYDLAQVINVCTSQFTYHLVHVILLLCQGQHQHQQFPNNLMYISSENKILDQ